MGAIGRTRLHEVVPKSTPREESMRELDQIMQRREQNAATNLQIQEMERMAAQARWEASQYQQGRSPISTEAEQRSNGQGELMVIDQNVDDPEKMVKTVKGGAPIIIPRASNQGNNNMIMFSVDDTGRICRNPDGDFTFDQAIEQQREIRKTLEREQQYKSNESSPAAPAFIIDPSLPEGYRAVDLSQPIIIDRQQQGGDVGPKKVMLIDRQTGEVTEHDPSVPIVLTPEQQKPYREYELKDEDGNQVKFSSKEELDLWLETRKAMAEISGSKDSAAADVNLKNTLADNLTEIIGAARDMVGWAKTQVKGD